VWPHELLYSLQHPEFVEPFAGDTFDTENDEIESPA